MAFAGSACVAHLAGREESAAEGGTQTQTEGDDRWGMSCTAWVA